MKTSKLQEKLSLSPSKENIQHFKIIYIFVTFVATKKGSTKNCFHPSLLFRFLDPGSGIRDPRTGIRDGQNSGPCYFASSIKRTRIRITTVYNYLIVAELAAEPNNLMMRPFVTLQMVGQAAAVIALVTGKPFATTARLLG